MLTGIVAAVGDHIHSRRPDGGADRCHATPRCWRDWPTYFRERQHAIAAELSRATGLEAQGLYLSYDDAGIPLLIDRD